jgi:hypothetical protein
VTHQRCNQRNSGDTSNDICDAIHSSYFRLRVVLVFAFGRGFDFGLDDLSASFVKRATSAIDSSSPAA